MKLPKSKSPTVFSEAKRQKTEEIPEKSPEIVLEEEPYSNNQPLSSPYSSSTSSPPIMPGTPLSTGKVKLNFILFLCN